MLEEFIKICKTQNYEFQELQGKRYISCRNHNALLKGINLTSVNRVPVNATTLVQQAEAVIDFDDECEALAQRIMGAAESEYPFEIGSNHQAMMAQSREKVKQLTKKYEKK